MQDLLEGVCIGQGRQVLEFWNSTKIWSLLLKSEELAIFIKPSIQSLWKNNSQRLDFNFLRSKLLGQTKDSYFKFSKNSIEEGNRIFRLQPETHKKLKRIQQKANWETVIQFRGGIHAIHWQGHGLEHKQPQ